MDTVAGVVLGMASRDVGGETRVVARWILGVPEACTRTISGTPRTEQASCRANQGEIYQASEVGVETVFVGDNRRCQRRAGGPPSLALKSPRATVDILRLSVV